MGVGAMASVMRVLQQDYAQKSRAQPCMPSPEPSRCRREYEQRMFGDFQVALKAKLMRLKYLKTKVPRLGPRVIVPCICSVPPHQAQRKLQPHSNICRLAMPHDGVCDLPPGLQETYLTLVPQLRAFVARCDEG